MKKTALLWIVMLVAVCNLMGQVNLMDVVKPSDSKRYEPYPASGKKTMKLAAYDYSNGFVLSTGLSGLIKADDPGGHVVFPLNGAYNKLSFVMGPGGNGSPSGASEGHNVILTVRGDGETLLDEVVWSHDAPREVVLDVSGVKSLRFDVFRGTTTLGFAVMKLYKANQSVTPTRTHLDKILVGKVKLVEQLWPYFIRGGGGINPICTTHTQSSVRNEESISINRVTYNSGIQFLASQAFSGNTNEWVYFWLQKKYDKLSFIVGPRDNQSSNATGWITVKGDDRILYEKLVQQSDLAEQVVLDISGVNQLSFHSVDQESDFVGSITFGVVDIYAYPAGSKDVPQPGVVNASKGRISELPDVCKLCSNIKPFSARGISSYDNTYFDGASQHYTFSMGGEQFSEGFVLTTGKKIFDDNINSYLAFDLAEEYDYVSFTAGCLSKHRVLDEDRLQVYADNQLIFDSVVHPVMPNMHIVLPINKCRTLKFAKPGTGKDKQTWIGVGDVAVYRGQPVNNNKLFKHARPTMPETVDLIDLTKGPYFHYVGRYLSSLTNFDFNDCFKNGGSQKEYFQMKDGSKIYKGIMLETNIPLGFEGAGIDDLLGAFFCPVGIIAGTTFLVDGGRQSSCAAFNVFNEFETCTFTVANKSVYVDEFDKMFGDKKADPVELKVYADTHLVGDFMVSDDMSPTTFIVPINKSEQLMFWLECGDYRSGQYVLYDMTLDKKPMANNPGVVTNFSKSGPSTKKQSEPQRTQKTEKVSQKDSKDAKNNKENAEKKPKKKGKAEKEEEQIVWEVGKRSRSKEVNDFLAAADEVWRATQKMVKDAQTNHRLNETYVQGNDGTAYKAVSFVDSRGGKLSISEILRKNESFKTSRLNITNLVVSAKIYLPNATLSLPSLGDKMLEFSSRLKTANKMMSQCGKQADGIIAVKEMESDMINEMLDKALTVDGVESTDKVLLLPLEEGEQVPEGTAMQQVRYYPMN